MKKSWRRFGWSVPKFEELKHKFEVSNFNLSVVFSPDIFSSAAYIADRDFLKNPTGSDTAEAFTHCAKSFAIIYLKPEADAGTIAHESYHAVRTLLRFIGAQEEEEVTAYHLDFVVSMVTVFQKKVAGRFKCKTKSLKSKRKTSSLR